MVAKYSIELAWKGHSVDLEGLEAWLRANAGEHYCGNSADSKLTLWFLEEPSEEIKGAMRAKWDDLDNEDADLCVSYKSQEQRAADRAAAKASARAKLAALGLTEQEIAALG